MSTCVNDVRASALVVAALHPTDMTEDYVGSTVDLAAGDGPCFAIQQVGAVSGTSPNLAGQIEQSADGTNWAAVSGAVFSTVAAANNVQVVQFVRSARYVRWSCAVTGTSPSLKTAVVVGQQRKTM